MLPSRGFARVGPGALSKNQIFASAPARSIPRLATFSTSIGSSRQFGTTLKSHGRPMTQSSRLGLLPNSRVGAATLLSSQTISLASARRFASTGSEPEASPIVNSGLSSDLTGDLSTLESLASIDQLPQKVGYLSELGLDYGWGPTSLCQWAMEHAHFTAGMSWGWSILGVAVLMRVVMFYPTLLGQQESAKMQALRKDPIYNELTTQMWSVGSKGGLVSQEVAMARMQMVALEKRAGIKKIRMVYSFLQIPLTFGMFKLCRAMAALPVPGMESQGFWWFQDLTAADPLYILPCVSTAMLFLSIRLSQANVPPQAAGLMKFMPWILGPVSILVTMKMAAGVTFYFATAAILQYLQSCVIFNPKVRTWAGLPRIGKRQAVRTPTSPFSNATYRAPRTVGTTAREVGKAGGQPTSSNPITAAKDAIASVTKSLEGYLGGTKEERDRKNLAEKFEVKKRKQEAADYFARQDAAKYKAKKNNKK